MKGLGKGEYLGPLDDGQTFPRDIPDDVARGHAAECLALQEKIDKLQFDLNAAQSMVVAADILGDMVGRLTEENDELRSIAGGRIVMCANNLDEAMREENRALREALEAAIGLLKDIPGRMPEWAANRLALIKRSALPYRESRQAKGEADEQ